MAKDRLDKVRDKLNKKYGKEVIRRGLIIRKEWFPTGITNLDWALGGGFIQGGFVELYGPPSSGKSTLALKAMALAQKQGKVCAYIDVEDAYDNKWAEINGINNDDLLLMDKEQVEEIAKKKDDGINAEFVLQLMIDLIDTKGIDILVLDSIACLTPKDELEKDLKDEARMAGVARLMSRALRVLNAKNQRKSTILFINQLRDNIGSYGGGSVTPGGQAVKFYSFQRVNVRRGKDVTEKGEIVGYNAKVKVDKSKVSIAKRSVEYVMYNDSSVDRFETYWNLAKNLENFGTGVELQGRTYSYNGEVVAKSQDEFRDWLKDNNDVFVKLEKSLISDVKSEEDDKDIEIDEVNIEEELQNEKEEILENEDGLKSIENDDVESEESSENQEEKS